ncbi:tandem-95 repeat protein, partial [Campylobacter sp. FMV-PI01]
IKNISINPLDTLLSAYDRNHDFKIDNKDIIYNYIYYKDNFDNSIDLYIYGDDNAKSFLNFDTTNHTILTNQGMKRVNEIHFYTDINSLPKPNTTITATSSSNIFANDIDNIITGSSSDDIIYGYGGDDNINAGDGNDILIGGFGSDTLIGGSGIDIYKADKFDTIIDSDKKGFVYLDDKLLSSAMLVGKDGNINTYIDHNSHIYKHDTINNTLIINDGLVIKDFTNGDLNINLRSQIGSDIVIVIDQTGSMGSAINSVKENAKFLINSLFNSDLGSKDSRVSIITYESTPNIIIPFTNDKEKALNAINKIGGTYGGTENINKALKTALDGSIGNFRDGVNKRIYIFGDESGDDNSFIKDSINMANKQDVNIYTISINSSPFSSFKELSNNTQALSLATSDYRKVGRLLFEAMLDGSNENDVIEADENSNTINAKAGDDIIRSFGGDDTIKAGSGNDYIDAGSGNDTIYTGTGDDILFFKKGDGKDKIFYDSGNKTLQFSSEITKNDISFYLDNKTFRLSYSKDDEITIDINLLNAGAKIELSDGNYLDTNAIFNALKTMKEYSIKNSVVLNHDIIRTNHDLSLTIANLFKQGEVTKIKNLASTTINSEILADLPTINPENSLYADTIRPLMKSDFKELIISSGYTGISTNGITAKAGANGGSLTFENRWYKSDTLDTIYESDGELKESSGVVRDFNDAINDNKNLKDSVDDLGNNFDTTSIDMDKILQDWVLKDNFLDNSSFLPPIVLDLNNNGITSLSLKDSDAYFNYGENYRRYKTAWIESGDAILGVDLNKDGIINSAFEVFGNKTKLKDGSFAKDGYEALKEFDSNSDGIIDINDDNFKNLVLWFDDGDAKGEAGELKTLSQAGVKSISLTPKTHKLLENGNKISFESSFVKDDESSGVLRDVWFEVSSKQSIADSNLSDSDEKKISIVEKFRGARLANHQRANPLLISQILDEYESIKYDMMSQILAKKLYGNNADSCTLLYSALNIKLSRIINGDATPQETTLSINLLASLLKKDFTYAIFKINPSYLSNEKIKTLLDKTGIKFSINAKDLNSIKGVIGKNVFGDNEAEIFDFSDNENGRNILSKGGNDILIGSNFHDKLNGGNGNDIIIGNDGIDTLIGSGGNDLLIGSKDSTIYEYYLGDGDDIIYDDGGKDILKLSFLKTSDLSVEKIGDDMVINIINPFEKESVFGSITIKDGYKDGKIEEFFIDDKIYTFDEFSKAVPASNTYWFKKGSSLVEIDDKGGIDKVIFSVTPNDIITRKNGSNLEIAIKMEGRAYDELLDKLIIKNFFTDLGEPNGVGKIESFIFDNGIILNSNEILLEKIDNDTFIMGDEKDNELIGTNNPNTINGKGGNDILKGLNGDDNYIYESGKDTIIDSGGNDKIVFGEGITRDSLQSKIIGGDLVIAIKESGVKFEDLKNSLTIKNQALADNKIEKVMYSDGSEFDIDTLKNREIITNEVVLKTMQDIREINSSINAIDEDGDKLTFELIENSKFGTFILNSNGSYTYKANDKFIGKDSVKVKISDGMGSEVVVTINLDIKISAPLIDTTKLKFDEDTLYKGTLNIDNPSNSNLTYELVGDTKNSLVVLNSDGSFIITPNLNYNGDDFFTIKVTNEYGLSDIKTIPLKINPINDAPKFKQNISNYKLTNTDQIIANLEASDIDSTHLTYKVISNPTNGFITIDENGNFTYIANKGYKGSDSAIVEVSDGELSTTKELKFNMNGYEYNSGNLEIPSNDLIDTTLKLPNLNVEDIKFNRSNNDLVLTQNSGDITIKDYFTKGAKTIDTLIFKNNQTINIDNTKLVLPNKKSWQIKPSANLNNSGIIFSDLKNSILNGSNEDDIIISTGDNSKIRTKGGDDTIILNGNKNKVYGSFKNDTLISNGKNNFLKGKNGDDTYIIGKDANNTIIRDKEYVNLIDGGNDTLILNDIDKSSVEFKLGGGFNKDLIINYSNSHSKDIKTLTIQNQTNKYSAIENINLDDTMLGAETINKIIQDLNSYSGDNAINLNFNSEFKNNDIMQIYNS